MFQKCRPFLLFALTYSVFLSSSAPAFADEAICLADAVEQDRRSPGMQNCALTEPFPGNGGRIVDGVFRASRYRTGDQNEHDKISQDIEGRGVYNYATKTHNNIVPYVGVRLNAGRHTVTPIDVHGRCRYVYNNSTSDIFIPFKTKNEWYAFTDVAEENYKNNGGGVQLKRCALPCKGGCDFLFGPTSVDFDAGDKGLDAGSKEKSFSTELPYAPEGTVWPVSRDPNGKALNEHTFKYQCKYTVKKELPCAKKGERDAIGKCVEAKGTPGAKECCYDEASQCVKLTRNWSETWRLDRVVAGPSQDGTGQSDRHNGWRWENPPEGAKLYFHSKRVAGESRPAVCGTGLDLVQIGNDCSEPPPSAVTDDDPKPKKKKKKGGGDDGGDGGTGACGF